MSTLFDKVCTILGRAKTAEVAPCLAPAEAAGAKVTREGEGDDWKRIVVARDGAQLKLTCSHFAGPGFAGEAGAFNKTSLGAYNFAKNLELPDADKRALLRRLSEMETIIGCVAEPKMQPEHYAVIFALAEAYDALVFDGTGFIDASGTCVGDRAGRTGERLWRPAEGAKKKSKKKG